MKAPQPTTLYGIDVLLCIPGNEMKQFTTGFIMYGVMGQVVCIKCNEYESNLNSY